MKAKGFAGGAGAQQRAGGLRMDGQKGIKRSAAAGAGTRSAMNAGAGAATRARSKAASKGVKKMGKAPASAAKARYKELSGKARKAKTGAFRSAAENRAAAGAKRSLNSMIEKRGVTSRKRKAKA